MARDSHELKFKRGDFDRQPKKINHLPHLKSFRKELRNNLMPAEVKFWKAVQKKNLDGRKFRRQHSVGTYILDFYCPAKNWRSNWTAKRIFPITDAIMIAVG